MAGTRIAAGLVRIARRRWVRRLAAVGAAAAVLWAGLVGIGISGGVVVRDDDGCPRSVGSLGAVSWADVVRHDGATYDRVDSARPFEPAAVDPSMVGERLGEVRCAIADDVQRPGYDLRDGEATFLEPGTTLHALGGVTPSLRIVAMDDEEPVVYEHRLVEGAETGADLLPLPPDAVAGITFLSAVDGTTVLGRITDPAEVAGFVAALRSAPVDTDAARDLGEGPRVFVALELAGQPPLTLAAYPEAALTSDGLRLPADVLDRLPPPS